MDCIFCKIVNGEIPSYKIYEDDNLLAFLDINPMSAGHTLIIPKKHTLDFTTISDDTLDNIMKAAKNISGLLVNKLDADGFTLTQNNGICQEVKHFHLHIIPQYRRKNIISVEDVYKKITQE